MTGRLWAAALIVGATLFVLGALVALVGKNEVKQANPTPQQTVGSLKRDVEEVKEMGSR